MMVKNDRLLKALRREPVDCTPVWIMRQAGRYLPEYRKVRQQAGDFISLCKNPELACEVTMQPLRRFDLDAAILFSDILMIPYAMNLGLYFAEGEGPKFERPLRDKAAIDKLAIPDPADDLGFVLDTVRHIIKALDGEVPLIGFAGSPWTVATYMVEGGSSKAFGIIKKMMFTEPQLLHNLLDKLTQATILYLQAQVAAGVQTLMVFDTWGGVLSTPDYQAFSLHYMQRIVSALKADKKNQHIPIILFTKNGNLWLEQIAGTGCDAVGLDWTIPIGQARQRIGDKVALQGNLDPAMLHVAPDKIRASVKHIIGDNNSSTGHVFNLGHGITPDINPEHVKALVDAVHEFGKH